MIVCRESYQIVLGRSQQSADLIQNKKKDHEIFKDFHWLLRGILYALMIISILMFSNLFIEYEPFIYQGF